jgi:hypothetical protein
MREKFMSTPSSRKFEADGRMPFAEIPRLREVAALAATFGCARRIE